MILSALLTSVGINLGLSLLFFTLYSVLRKQPVNVTVYAPRLIAEGKCEQTGTFNLDRLLPTAGWLQRAWQPSEDDLLSNLGLDAVVFMRIIIFSLRVFTFAVFVGVFVLLPINFKGTQLSDDSDLPRKSLESFSISNVNDGSNRLWVHFCAAYAFTGVVCYLLYHEYKYISSKRISYFYESKPMVHQFSILVSGIPTAPGNTYSETVDQFFKEYHPSTYLSHIVVRRNNKLQSLVDDAEKLHRQLSVLKQRNVTSPRFRREGFLGLFGRKVDLVDYYEKKLESLEDSVRVEQSSPAGKEVPAAFVSFKSRFGAAIALNIQEGVNPTEWVTEQAPEPHDVYWPFFSTSFIKKWIRKVVVFVACAAVTLLFLIPVVIVQGLANLDQLQTWFPFLKKILKLAGVSQVITGYLPSLILQLFLYFVPPIMTLLSSMQGYISLSQIQNSACTKVLLFTIWNIFFANVLSGSALYHFNIFLEPKDIPRILAQAVPAQASFFISYVVTSGWTSLTSELFRLTSLFSNCISRTLGCTADDFEAPSILYHSEIPRILFFSLLGITYFFLAPLILPFILVYFCLGYIIFRNQMLNIYVPKYETGGRFWPTVHSSIIFFLVLMHIIAVGSFGLKKLPLASTLTVPLPILTLLFNDYCQKRFLPIFKAYPAECMIKKDRKDQNDANMSAFYDMLVNAYNDPALAPINYSARSDDRHTTPLLRSSDV